MGLSDTQYELLKHLNKAKETNPGNPWVSIEECNKNTVKSLERLEYIEVDTPRISAVITKSGQVAYVDEKRERNGLRDVVTKPSVSSAVQANGTAPIEATVVTIQPEAVIPPRRHKRRTSARITAPSVSIGRFLTSSPQSIRKSLNCAIRCSLKEESSKIWDCNHHEYAA